MGGGEGGAVDRQTDRKEEKAWPVYNTTWLICKLDTEACQILRLKATGDTGCERKQSVRVLCGICTCSLPLSYRTFQFLVHLSLPLSLSLSLSWIQEVSKDQQQ